MTAPSPVCVQFVAEEAVGVRLHGAEWGGFVSALTAELSRLTVPGSSGASPSFVFADLGSFFVGWQDALRAAGARLPRWTRLGPLPVRVVAGEGSVPGGDLLEARTRRLLRLEAVYATAGARSKWERRDPKPDEPPLAFFPEAHGLFRVGRGDDPRGGDPELFGFRCLPVANGPDCFYCNLGAHPDGDCPSRYLDSDVHGLDEVGRMPLGVLSAAYAQAFADPRATAARLAVGVSPGVLRRDPPLAAFAAHFDLTRLYQVRFLMTLAFGRSAGWPGLRNPGRLNTGNRSALYLALDCLRVRKLPEALAILEDPRKIGKSNNFYAAVALAFAALEREGPREMSRYLARALPLAAEREERLYLHLLWSRCFEVRGDWEGAQAEADRAADLRKDCAETVYRRLQLAARCGEGEGAVARLRALAQGDREYFLCTLLDPALLPVHHAADNSLREIWSSAADGAREGVKRLEKEYDALVSWLDEADPDLDTYRTTLARLKEGAEGGYYDLLDAADRSRELALLFGKLKDRKRRQLLTRFHERRRRLDAYGAVWRAYPYRALFQKLERVQTAVAAGLREGGELASSQRADGYREARKQLERVDSGLAELEASVEELKAVATALTFFKRFATRLFLLEMAVIPVSVVAVPLLEKLAPGTGGGVFSFQRAAVLLVWFIAPCAALALSVGKRGDKKP